MNNPHDHIFSNWQLLKNREPVFHVWQGPLRVFQRVRASIMDKNTGAYLYRVEIFREDDQLAQTWELSYVPKTSLLVSHDIELNQYIPVWFGKAGKFKYTFIPAVPLPKRPPVRWMTRGEYHPID